MSAPLSREAAVERLAKRLYENEYRLDPPAISSGPFNEWDAQTEYVRDLYRELVEDLLLDREAIESAFVIMDKESKTL